ncbi:MAG: T9SS type A sorting domain-containing protein [Ignavibacteria bacterium]|nr:T9SS type A sorting domain-containing protein [Ignavibacteria bacterium]
MKKINFKQHLFLLLILLFSPLIIYNFYKPGIEKQTQPPAPYENHNIYDKFILGAMDEETGAHNQGYSTTDSLELNISHAYTSAQWLNINGINRYVPKGRTPSDLMLSNVDSYKLEVTTYLKDIYTHNGRRSITQRPKIQWLCYGQSSVYQAEPIPAGNDLWFYSYNHNDVGRQVTDGHRTVIYCRPANSTNQGNWVDNPGDVVRGLKANTEQCNPSDNFDGDMNCEWIVKPCIRIPVEFVIPANYETPVCKVIVLKQDGVTPKENAEFIIKAKYFRDPITLQYDGSYIEEFNFFGEGGDQSFRGNLGDKWWLEARGTNPTDAGLANKTDIKVEWLGNCDMWLDYVKVENDIADGLLNDNHPDHQRYLNWIRDEVEQIAFGGFGSGHIFKTTNSGSSWQDISGNLPDVPHQSVCIDPLFPQNVYAGNDLGVFVSTTGGTQWYEFKTGMPYALVIDLKVVGPNRMLRAATHGNGAYQRKLVESPIGITQTGNEVPKEFKLYLNYPNPFNPTTKIRFLIPLSRGVSAESGRGVLTKLLVYDISGRLVRVLVNQSMKPGSYEVTFNGSSLASGVYFYKVLAGDYVETRKMMLIK